MTREEAIERIKEIKDRAWGYHIGGEVLGFMYDEFMEIMDAALSALRPISREQVEQVWRGEWMSPIFTGQNDANDSICQCSECGSIETTLARHQFCPNCGAPMTNEAMGMVMERLEVLKDNTVQA